MANGSLWYMVKNVSAADKANSQNSGTYHFNNGVDDWDMLSYSSATYPGSYTFDGTEDYAVTIAEPDVEQNQNNPIFRDYSSDTPAVIGAILHRYAENNRRMLLGYLDQVFIGHLVKNATTWTPAQKTTYKDQVDELYMVATTGDVGWVREVADGITPVAPLTAAMITEFTDLCDVYKEMFPDGT